MTRVMISTITTVAAPMIVISVALISAALRVDSICSQLLRRPKEEETT
jgi:hypothetical protein